MCLHLHREQILSVESLNVYDPVIPTLTSRGEHFVIITGATEVIVTGGVGAVDLEVTWVRERRVLTHRLPPITYM